MSADEPKDGPPTKPPPATPAWRRARVIGRADVIDSAELVGQPGTCAGCRGAFKDHTDAQLHSCAALFEPTRPREGEP
jgi:hypothetical protein